MQGRQARVSILRLSCRCMGCGRELSPVYGPSRHRRPHGSCDAGATLDNEVQPHRDTNDLHVAMDTNHLERNLRAIPMGRKNWNFCWTELGAKHVGIAQSLMVTCRLHGIDVYTYLVDVLQRISQHPASRVAELTPRLWKQLFAGNPLRSDLHNFPC